MPTALLLSLPQAHQDVPSGRSPISQSLSSDGTLESRVRAGSGRGPAGRACSAELEGEPLFEERKRHRSGGHVQASSVPKLLGSLGTASGSKVENEKCAESLPSRLTMDSSQSPLTRSEFDAYYVQLQASALKATKHAAALPADWPSIALSTQT
jgi:hypothetical protein